MNILHVLSQREVTGAETFAATLATVQVRAGHGVWIVSDTFHSKTSAQVVSEPIGKRDAVQRIRNIFTLRSFISKNKIDVVHAHSRAASWVSAFATLGKRVPLLSTIHGRQHIHLSTKISSLYGQKILAVCEDIFEHLIEDLGFDPDSISVVRNGLALDDWKSSPDDRTKERFRTISIIGRLSGPKGELLQKIVGEVIPLVLKRDPDIVVNIVGGMSIPESVRKFVDRSVEKNHRGAIRHHGFSENVKEYYCRSSLIIGSGRVAMEALATGARVIAVGESNYVGAINEATKGEALMTNFGDSGKRVEFDAFRMADDIITAIGSNNGSTYNWGREFVSSNYDINLVARQVSSAYAEAAALKNGLVEIPVLMYHRITDGVPAGTRHGTYVTKKDFERQLASLERRRRTPLTFVQMKEILEGKRSLPDRPIMITFDDGYEDNYLNAFPLLRSYSFSATVFLLGNRSLTKNEWDTIHGEPVAGLLTDSQIKEMYAGGIEFGAHSMTHKMLTEIPLSEAETEIRRSKAELEQRLGVPVISFAYPYGRVNERVKHIARDAGYVFGAASDSGPRNFWKDSFEIRRIQVFPNTSPFSFWKKSSGRYHRYKSVR